jgi:hypothetical protein
MKLKAKNSSTDEGGAIFNCPKFPKNCLMVISWYSILFVDVEQQLIIKKRVAFFILCTHVTKKSIGNNLECR